MYSAVIKSCFCLCFVKFPEQGAALNGPCPASRRPGASAIPPRSISELSPYYY